MTAPSLDDIRSGHWADLTVATPPDARVVGATVVAAIGTDLAVRSGVFGLAGALLTLGVPALMWSTRRVPNGRAWPLLAAAAAFGPCLLARSSPWLLPLDVLASAGLLVLAATFARAGDPLDLTVPSAIARGLVAFVGGLAAPGFLLALRTRRSSQSGTGQALVRGLLLAAPLLFVLGVLLASADAVFASVFRLPDDGFELVLHAMLLAVGSWGMAGLLRVASARSMADLPRNSFRLGSVEVTTVLGAIVALHAAFAVSQLVVVAGGARHVLDTEGLTYAEYARSGFFQLLAVAGLTLAALMAIRAVAPDRGDDAASRLPSHLLVLSEAAVALTVVIVAVALRRLHLYEVAYGLTMLRLVSTVAAVWIGAVFVLFGISLAGVGAPRRWFVPAATAAAVVALFGLNLANPEAVVVRRNVAHHAETGKIDTAYLASLSADATPSIVDALPKLPPHERQLVLDAICARPRTASGGFWAYNASEDGAIEARNRVCPDEL